MDQLNERNCLKVHKDGKEIYEIRLESSFHALPERLQFMKLEHKKICIVTDHKIGKLYARELEEILTGSCREIFVFEIPSGEQYKTLDTVKRLYEYLINNHFDRRDLMVALGGGVIGDLTGYTAATYLRGIDFIQIPTTLLSQVDSSIGGKTGVDFDGYKNMVGAFYQPRLVYMNLSVLNTLDDKQFASGMAEIIKHGLIKSEPYEQWIAEQGDQIKAKDFQALREMIYQSCQIKKQVVENDPYEKGERALLNFGHTIGHAVEKIKDFTMLHGECVAIGIVAASYLSYLRGAIRKETLQKIESLLTEFALPVRVPGIDVTKVFAVTKSDKKMHAGQIRFILLEQVGKAVMDDSLSEEELRAAIAYIGQNTEEIQV